VTGKTTGFAFRKADAGDLFPTLWRVMGLWQTKANWRQLQRTALTEDYS